MSSILHDLAPSELWLAAEAAAADHHTMDVLGMSTAVLMERASLCVTHVVERLLGRRDRVCVLCGPGNNGGDGLAVARQLHGRGHPVEVRLVTASHNTAVAEQLAWARSHGVRIEQGLGEHPTDPLVIVDALLGTGASGEPRGAIADAITWIRAEDRVVAIDCPTGVEVDTGAVGSLAIKAAHTVTFQRSKPGLHVWPGRNHAGRIHVADIGLTRDRDVPVDGSEEWRCSLIDPHWVARRLEALPGGEHKGERGHLGLIAGSGGTPGAAVLAGEAALRVGAGIVTIASDDSLVQAQIIASRPELMIVGRAGAVPAAAALVVGPGLVDPASREGLEQLWGEDPRPAVWDASALDHAPIVSASGPRIMTPHPGEAARLLSRVEGGTDRPSASVQAGRMIAARSLSEAFAAVVVLKGEGTIVASPTGELAIDVLGTSALATAGTGDVLAGAIGGLLARGVGAWDAARIGVVLHGCAGRQASQRFLPLAGDVANSLVQASPSMHDDAWPEFLRG